MNNSRPSGDYVVSKEGFFEKVLSDNDFDINPPNQRDLLRWESHRDKVETYGLLLVKTIVN